MFSIIYDVIYIAYIKNDINILLCCDNKTIIEQKKVVLFLFQNRIFLMYPVLGVYLLYLFIVDTDFEIDKLTCYGFRGEALSSICAVADVTVITRSEFDKYAKSFTMDNNGHVINSSISHHQKG